MYEDFSLVYDELMDDIPYEEWADMLDELIIRYGVSKRGERAKDPLESEKNLVLDLACGTGTITELMYEKGYDMIGVDLSPDMLDRALEKKDRSGSDILYLNQDMRELDLYCTAGTVFCLCDSINYLLTSEDVIKVFTLVNNFLYPGGVFIFDFNTIYKYKEVIGDSTIAEDREDSSFIWENFYDDDSHINEYDLTVFIREEGKEDLYRKSVETHLQRGYSLKEMEELLESAGLSVVISFDMDNGERKKPDEKSERIFIVAKKAL